MGKKDHRHEIQAIIELTQKLDHNDIAYFSKGQIPYLTSHSFSDVCSSEYYDYDSQTITIISKNIFSFKLVWSNSPSYGSLVQQI